MAIYFSNFAICEPLNATPNYTRHGLVLLWYSEKPFILNFVFLRRSGYHPLKDDSLLHKNQKESDIRHQ